MVVTTHPCPRNHMRRPRVLACTGEDDNQIYVLPEVKLIMGITKDMQHRGSYSSAGRHTCVEPVSRHSCDEPGSTEV